MEQMRKVKQIIPNTLTVSRILLTIGLVIVYPLFRFYDVSHYLTIVVILTLLIYSSDILDGRLARKWNVCSKFGEQLDVIADVFYIISQCTILFLNGKMPITIIVCIILEFFIFIYTSLYLNGGSEDKVFVFEKAGKAMAVYYYLIPMIYSIASIEICTVAEIICLFGTGIIIIYRIFLVEKKMYSLICEKE